MATPSELVNQFGNNIKLYRAKDNEEVSYENPVEIKAVVSNPRDLDDVEKYGRVDMGGRTITIKKDIDISNNRNGLPDVVEIGGDYYQVSEVRNVNHALAGIKKKTVDLEELDVVKESVLEPD